VTRELQFCGWRWRVFDVECLDRLRMNGIDLLSSDLHRWCQLATGKTQIAIENVPAANVLRARYRVLVVVAIDSVLDHLHELGTALGGTDGLGITSCLGTGANRSIQQLIGALAVVRIGVGAQSQQASQELALVADDDAVADGRKLLLDDVFNQHWWNILTASSDDQFFDSASDEQEAYRDETT
jgi:hypothetical protein